MKASHPSEKALVECRAPCEQLGCFARVTATKAQFNQLLLMPSPAIFELVWRSGACDSFHGHDFDRTDDAKNNRWAKASRAQSKHKLRWTPAAQT